MKSVRNFRTFTVPDKKHTSTPKMRKTNNLKNCNHLAATENVIFSVSVRFKIQEDVQAFIYMDSVM